VVCYAQVYDEEYDSEEDQDQPDQGGMTIIRRGLSGRWIDIRMTLASSLGDDCTAHDSDDS
jgi:hypothetical protein